jgi:two-component system nitrate/nitrite response regulator NarL
MALEKIDAADFPASRSTQRSGSSQRPRWIPTVIVDKNALFRAGLIHILAGTRFRVIADCSDLSNIQHGRLNGPICMALVGIDDKGARAVRSELLSLKAQHERLRIVIFSDRFDLEELFTAIASGGDCYLLKNEVSPEAILKSLELALMGETIVPQGFGQLLRDQACFGQDALSPGKGPASCLSGPQTPFLTNAGQTGEIVRLSDKEQIILLHLTRGTSNKQIARELEITEATVKTHVKALLRKISARNRTQAAMWAVSHLALSRVDQARPPKCSAGPSLVLARLGSLATDPSDEPATAPDPEHKSYAIQ